MLNIFTFKKIEVKAQREDFVSFRMAGIKKTDNIDKCWQRDVEKLKLSYCGWSEKCETI